MIIKCPVCSTTYDKEIEACATCKFTELNKVFISQEDFKEWVENVVKPFREKYQK